jgi:hypothetical protein
MLFRFCLAIHLLIELLVKSLKRLIFIYFGQGALLTLSLLLKEIVKSTNPSLSFAARTYSLGKGIMNYIKNHSLPFIFF